MFLSEWCEFPSAPCLAGKKKLMTARVSMLLKSRTSLTCFRACFLPVGLRTYQHPYTENYLKLQVKFYVFQWGRCAGSKFPDKMQYHRFPDQVNRQEIINKFMTCMGVLRFGEYSNLFGCYMQDKINGKDMYKIVIFFSFNISSALQWDYL